MYNCLHWIFLFLNAEAIFHQGCRALGYLGHLGELVISLTAQGPVWVPAPCTKDAEGEKGWMKGVHAWKHSCVSVQAHGHRSPGSLLLSACLCLNVYLSHSRVFHPRLPWTPTSHSKLTWTEELKALGCEEEKAGE